LFIVCLPAKLHTKSSSRKLLIGLKPKAKYSVLPVCHVMSHSAQITLIKSTIFSETVNYHPQFQLHTHLVVLMLLFREHRRGYVVTENGPLQTMMLGWPPVARRAYRVLWKLVNRLKTFNGNRPSKTGFCHHVNQNVRD